MRNKEDWYMPAEWARHERTFIEWPVRASLVWPDMYEEVCAGYSEVVRAVARFEPVTLIVNEDTAKEAEALCGGCAELLSIPHNDAWCRDNGPTFLVNGKNERAAVNWRFNAWGEKYRPFDLDNEVTPKLLGQFHVPYSNSPIVLEGGSIHVDGEGTLLTTRECLLNRNRNPQLTEREIALELKSLLGIQKIIWLNRGLSGDETDGHVDNVACFASPGAVLMQTCADPEDENFESSRENLEILRTSADAAGRQLEVVTIPQPPARFFRGERLTLSYLNFYLVNGGLILPVFGGDAEASDRTAEAILQTRFPDRTIVRTDGMSLIREGGNVHCITQQMPACAH